MIGFIGAGNMGTSLIKAVLENSNSEILVFDSQDKSNLLQNHPKKNRLTLTSLQEVVTKSHSLYLCVKPKDFTGLAKTIQPFITEKHTIISIMAGVNISIIKKNLGKTCEQIIRIMPNTPALISKGAGAMAFYQIEESDKQDQLKLFNQIGYFVEVEEKQLHAVTALSGSGPAYAFMIIEAMTDAGVKLGLNRDLATQLATHTLLGSASLVAETKQHPMVLKDQVTSPAGTTIQALSVLEKEGLPNALIEAITAAYKKSVKLEKKMRKEGKKEDKERKKQND